MGMVVGRCGVGVMQEDLSSLKREIHILKRCKCAYVVEFIDCFFLDNELWIVMEFCLGGSVSDMLDATETTLTEPQIRSICACVALGLAYLHEQHNIHRYGVGLLAPSGHGGVSERGACNRRALPSQARHAYGG